MLSGKQLFEALKKNVIRAASLPFFILVIGIALQSLNNINVYFNWTKKAELFQLTDTLGDIFVTLAFLTFVYRLFFLILRRYERKLNETSAVASLVLTNVRKTFQIIFILIAVHVIIDLIGLRHGYLILTSNILNVLIIASIGWICVQILTTVEAVVSQKMRTLPQNKELQAKSFFTKVKILKNIGTVIISFITVAAILMSFTSLRSIGISLLASAGFLTAILGFAAQKPLSALFSGLQIAAAQPIKIGDIVSIDKGIGVIEEISFTYVTIHLNDEQKLFVPITYFIENAFENFSFSASFTDKFDLSISHDTSIDPLREEFNRILKNSAYWDGKVGKLLILDLKEKKIDLRFQISANQISKLAELRSEILEKLFYFLKKNNKAETPA